MAMTIFDYWKNYRYCLLRFSFNNLDLRLWWQDSLSEKILKEIFNDVQENLCIFFFEKNYILNCFISIFQNTDRFWIKKKTELKLVVWFKKNVKHYTTLSFRDITEQNAAWPYFHNIFFSLWKKQTIVAVTRRRYFDHPIDLCNMQEKTKKNCKKKITC